MNISFSILNTYHNILTNVKQAGADCAIVAGGAVRDMLLGKTISDIDVFYEASKKIDTWDTWLDWNVLAPHFKSNPLGNDSLEDDYNNPKWTVTHGNLLYKPTGQAVQLIKVDNVYEHVNTFGCNLSKVIYSAENGLIMSEEFLDGVKFGVLEFTDAKETYKNKIMAKYPEYAVS